MNVPPEYVRTAIEIERKACADLAESHRGSAAKRRFALGRPLGEIEDDGLVVQIRAEERGEDIAAEIISHDIRCRTPGHGHSFTRTKESHE